METLHRLHIADDRTFFALPRRMQSLHYAHTRNHIKGAYIPAMPDDEASELIHGPGSDALQVSLALARIRKNPPSPRAIADARTVVDAPPGMPQAIIDAAHATLERAGVDYERRT